MSKNKSHKSTLKRIRLTKTGKVRHSRTGGKHLRSHKSGKHLRRLRQDKFVSNAVAKRLEKLLFRRLRGRDQARASIKKSPSPEQSVAIKAERAAALADAKAHAKPDLKAGKKLTKKVAKKAGVKKTTKKTSRTKKVTAA